MSIESILLSPQKRWENGGGENGLYTLRDGRTIEAPVFDLGEVQLKELHREYISDKRRVIGYFAQVAAYIYGEAPRFNQLRKIYDDEAINANIYIGDGAAFGTDVRGYPDERAHQLAMKRVSSIQRGEGYSHHTLRDSINPLRIAKAGLGSHRVSQMRSAQIEQANEAAIREQYEFPARSFQLGDSQPGIKMAATVFAAETLHGAEVVGVNPRAILCYEAFSHKDTFEFGRWLVDQGLAALKLVSKAIVKKDKEAIIELALTIDIDPAFLTNAILGSAPALLNGELAHTTDYLRRDIGGMQTVGVKDHLLRKTAKTTSAKFPNMHIEKIDAGHLFVADRDHTHPQVDFIEKVVRVDASGGDLSRLTQDQIVYLYGENSNVQGNEISRTA